MSLLGQLLVYSGRLREVDVETSVNGGSSVVVDQPNTGGGHVVFSVPVQVHLNEGSNNVTFGAGQSSELST